MRYSGPPDRSAAAGVIGAAVAVALAVAAVVVWTTLRDDPSSALVGTRGSEQEPVATIAPGARHVGVAPAVESLVVLRDWDRARAAAWAAGDTAALGRLYARGSEAGRRDVAMLRRWNGRGLRVEGMTMQLLAVELGARTSRRIVLTVTDRVTGARAVRAGTTGTPTGTPTATPTALPLPNDRPSTRRLTFAKNAGRWVLVSATPARP